MFGTLRYVADREDGEFLQLEMGSPGRGPVSRPQACDNCRVKKIRCNGRRSGCARCSTLQVQCTYSESTTRRGPRKRSSPPRYINASAEENTQEQIRNTTPQSMLETSKDIDPLLTHIDGETSGADHLYLNNFDWALSNNEPQDSSIQMDTQLGPDSSSLPDADESSTANGHSAKSRDHGNSANMNTSFPVMLHAPSLLSPPATSSESRRDAPQRENRAMCSCLPTAVFLLDELEASSGNAQERHLDSQLSSYRETLSCCERMLQCSTCRNRPENMTVLNLVLERLVGLCESVVGAYFNVIDSSSNSGNAAEHHQWSTSKSPPPTSRASEWPEMVLGDYDIAGPDWKTLVRVLIFMQMGALDSLLTRMKRMPSMAQRDSQMVRLVASEQRNARIARRLWPGLPETTPLSESGPYMILKLWSI